LLQGEVKEKVLHLLLMKEKFVLDASSSLFYPCGGYLTNSLSCMLIFIAINFIKVNID